MARPISLIVIHCSASPNGDSLFRGRAGEPGFRTPVQAIDAWHKARGFHRKPEFVARHNASLTAIGYHFVVYTSGVIATGRHLDEIGAHATGFNQKSVGVCLVGTDAFTAEQWAALRLLVEALRLTYPGARVVGHRDLSPDLDKDGKVERNEWTKTCPGFDVSAWIERRMVAEPGRICEEKR